MFTLTEVLKGFTFLAAALSAFANPMTKAERENLESLTWKMPRPG